MCVKTFWWAQPNGVPASVSSNPNILYECEDQVTGKRGGPKFITRDVYVLHPDYSQTTISAVFEADDPANVKFEQSFTAPPSLPSKDELRQYSNKIGAAATRLIQQLVGQKVGDGSDQALIRHVQANIPGTLFSIGLKTHGICVYMNIGNSSVRQLDEIRPGDIILFRTAKFQGHKGSLHQKYSLDLGSPVHTGFVAEWDGSKRKVKVVEQSREKGKVRAESYRIPDMKSGEIEVYRMVDRSYVGWQ
ncbi:hypothetical protein CANCADRAFT_26198 [Tortispora caseinolytica NRRL Y-17796]|uniref:BBC1/AIM3 cysteine proteinase-fold domain-containing protein n=1 Tax=Tortispora caseinolytica NRRL Y-17796 TaxID=767744 RepID=A0A1E4TH11_9ASCO|nr:hypothetical protein CANCADRAFT_26198 [Tortispora caseinolytica NRRL Y-17796]